MDLPQHSPEEVTQAVRQGRENALEDSVRAWDQSKKISPGIGYYILSSEVATLLAACYASLNSEEPSSADLWLQLVLSDAATILERESGCSLHFVVGKREGKEGDDDGFEATPDPGGPPADPV